MRGGCHHEIGHRPQRAECANDRHEQPHEERTVAETQPRSAVLPFRLSRQDVAALEQAAEDSGMTVSEYLREAAAMRPADTVLAKPQITYSVNTLYSQSGTVATWRESPTTAVSLKTSTTGNVRLRS